MQEVGNLMNKRERREIADDPMQEKELLPTQQSGEDDPATLTALSEEEGNDTEIAETEEETPFLFDAPDPRGKRRKRKKKPPMRSAIIALACSAALLVLMIAIYYIAEKRQAEQARIDAQLAAEEQIRQQQAFEQDDYERMANATVFLDGVTVDGLPIGGMTREEAKTALLPVDEKARKLGNLTLTYGTQTFTLVLDPLITSTNLDEVLAEAWNLARSGTYDEMKAQAADVAQNGKAYTLEISGYDAAALSARVSELAAGIDKPMQDASVSHIDTENRTIEFADEVVGETVQQEALVNLIANAIETRDLSPVAIPVLETIPIVTREALAGQYALRASATTSFSDSSRERKYNIAKGAGLINGTVLKPGETFSTNDTLGTRTLKNGWKMAGAYENGSVVEQAGGGVCQLSSTLYNAVVKADLEIVYRRNHSMPVKYIDKGLDATINSVGNMIDFQFKNNTGSDIVIFGYTIDNKKVTFEVWGVPFATSEYDEIRLTSEQVSVQEPDGEPVEILVPEGTVKPDGSTIVAGERYIAVASRKGYVYQSYKHFYKNGVEVRSEKLASSTYKAFAGEIWIGPELETTPEPFYTPEPIIEPPIITDPAAGDPGVPADVLF